MNCSHIGIHAVLARRHRSILDRPIESRRSWGSRTAQTHFRRSSVLQCFRTNQIGGMSTWIEKKENKKLDDQPSKLSVKSNNITDLQTCTTPSWTAEHSSESTNQLAPTQLLWNQVWEDNRARRTIKRNAIKESNQRRSIHTRNCLKLIVWLWILEFSQSTR